MKKIIAALVAALATLGSVAARSETAEPRMGRPMNSMFLDVVVAAIVLACISPAMAAPDKSCIREMREVFGVGTKQAKRMCDPKIVAKPNEYGWVCEVDPEIKIYKLKGHGTRLKRDVVCE
jgi:hypothetical protein